MSQILDRSAFSPQAALAIDPLLLLSEHLPSGWIVEASTSPDGRPGIVVFAEEETDTSPTFYIYDEAGRLRLATVIADEWLESRPCRDYAAAVSAIVSAIGQ